MHTHMHTHEGKEGKKGSGKGRRREREREKNGGRLRMNGREDGTGFQQTSQQGDFTI